MKLILSVFFMALLSGCVSSQRMGEGDNVWVADTTNVLGLYYQSTYYYCMAHKPTDGKSAGPACYPAAMYFRE